MAKQGGLCRPDLCARGLVICRTNARKRLLDAVGVFVLWLSSTLVLASYCIARGSLVATVVSCFPSYSMGERRAPHICVEIEVWL